jgi:hypothetical protein
MYRYRIFNSFIVIKFKVKVLKDEKQDPEGGKAL